VESRSFRWACLGVAVIALGVAGWMVNDMRSVDDLKQHHPESKTL
jgi:hypothetical protein